MHKVCHGRTRLHLLERPSHLRERLFGGALLLQRFSLVESPWTSPYPFEHLWSHPYPDPSGRPLNRPCPYPLAGVSSHPDSDEAVNAWLHLLSSQWCLAPGPCEISGMFADPAGRRWNSVAHNCRGQCVAGHLQHSLGSQAWRLEHQKLGVGSQARHQEHQELDLGSRARCLERKLRSLGQGCGCHSSA